MTNVLTYSSTKSFMTCHRRYRLQYELGIRKRHQSEALRIGTAVHNGLEHREPNRTQDTYKDIPPWAVDNPIEKRKWLGEAALAYGMVEAYLDYYEDDLIEPLASEMKFKLPIINPDTNRPSRGWFKAGKLDKRVRLLDGTMAVMDHKTTTYDIAPGSDFWLHLRLDRQTSMYIQACRDLGFEIDKAYYDAIRKPAIKPKQNESINEYCIRVYDTMMGEPTRYFQRQVVPRLDADLEQFNRELWQLRADIMEARKHGRWYRNCGACHKPYRCPYLNICATYEEGGDLPSGFYKVDDPHVDLKDDPSTTEKKSGDASV